MAVANNWREPRADYPAWQADLEKRLMNEERRPLVTQASDLLGPGAGPFAVETLDWNADECSFVGVFYSRPGAANAPLATRYWMGETFGTSDGHGFQRLTSYQEEPPLVPAMTTYRRKFSTQDGVRGYTAWEKVDGVAIGVFVEHLGAGPSDALLCDGTVYSLADYPVLGARMIAAAIPGGDGVTTFAVPNLSGVMLRGSLAAGEGAFGGSDTVTLAVANLPPHAHAMNHGHTLDTRETGPGNQNRAMSAGLSGTINDDNTAPNNFVGDTGTGQGTSAPFSILSRYMNARISVGAD